MWHVLGGAIVGAVVGAVSGAVSEVVSAAVEGRDINFKAMGKNALTGALSGAASGAVLAATGSTTLAGAAGGTVNGIYNEAKRAAVTGEKFNLGNVGKSAFVGTVSGTVSGFVGGISRGVTSQVTGSNLIGTLVGGTSASVTGGMVNRAIDGNAQTSTFSIKDIGKDILTGGISSLAGYGVYSAASRTTVGGLDKAMQQIGQKVSNDPESKIAGSMVNALNALRTQQCNGSQGDRGTYNQNAGNYLAGKAPKQVTPGVRKLEGQYIADL